MTMSLDAQHAPRRPDLTFSSFEHVAHLGDGSFSEVLHVRKRSDGAASLCRLYRPALDFVVQCIMVSFVLVLCAQGKIMLSKL